MVCKGDKRLRLACFLTTDLAGLRHFSGIRTANDQRPR